MEELKEGLFDIEIAKIFKLYEHNINLYVIKKDDFAPVSFLNYTYEDLDTSFGHYSINFSIFKKLYYDLKKNKKKQKR